MSSGALPSLGSLIHDVTRLMKRRFDEHAREHGLSLPQWRVMAQLSREGQLSQVALANLIDSDPMTVSRMVERMENAGLVARVADPADSRAKLVRLTGAAHALLETMRPVGEAVFDEALRGFTPSERGALVAGLERIRSNLVAAQAQQAGK